MKSKYHSVDSFGFSQIGIDRLQLDNGTIVGADEVLNFCRGIGINPVSYTSNDVFFFFFFAIDDLHAVFNPSL